METKMAPIYSILVMGCFEEILYQKIEEEMDQETSEYIRNTRKRNLTTISSYGLNPEKNSKNFINY